MNRRDLLKAAGGAMAMGALAGCSSSDADGDTGAVASQAQNATSMNAQVTRLLDCEAGVVCYIRDHSGGAGESISCVPMEDTDLTQEDCA